MVDGDEAACSEALSFMLTSVETVKVCGRDRAVVEIQVSCHVCGHAPPLHIVEARVEQDHPLVLHPPGIADGQLRNAHG
nr:hypothetical protein [Nocardia terpenica]